LTGRGCRYVPHIGSQTTACGSADATCTQKTRVKPIRNKILHYAVRTRSFHQPFDGVQFSSTTIFMEILIGAIISLGITILGLHWAKNIRQKQHEALEINIGNHVEDLKEVVVEASTKLIASQTESEAPEQNEAEIQQGTLSHDVSGGMIPVSKTGFRSKLEMKEYGVTVTSDRERVTFVKYQTGTPEQPIEMELPVTWNSTGREIWKAFHGIIELRRKAGLKAVNTSPGEMISLHWEDKPGLRTEMDYTVVYLDAIAALIHSDSAELSEILNKAARQINSPKFSIRWKYENQAVTFSRNSGSPS